MVEKWNNGIWNDERWNNQKENFSKGKRKGHRIWPKDRRTGSGETSIGDSRS